MVATMLCAIGTGGLGLAGSCKLSKKTYDFFFIAYRAMIRDGVAIC